MITIVEIMCNNRDLMIQKVNNIAGYFNEEKFKDIGFQLQENGIEKELKKNNVCLSDFSPYVQELCQNDYSKLSIIITLAYCVEV